MDPVFLIFDLFMLVALGLVLWSGLGTQREIIRRNEESLASRESLFPPEAVPDEQEEIPSTEPGYVLVERLLRETLNDSLRELYNDFIIKSGKGEDQGDNSNALVIKEFIERSLGVSARESYDHFIQEGQKNAL